MKLKYFTGQNHNYLVFLNSLFLWSSRPDNLRVVTEVSYVYPRYCRDVVFWIWRCNYFTPNIYMWICYDLINILSFVQSSTFQNCPVEHLHVALNFVTFLCLLHKQGSALLHLFVHLFVILTFYFVHLDQMTQMLLGTLLYNVLQPLKPTPLNFSDILFGLSHARLEQ